MNIFKLQIYTFLFLILLSLSSLANGDAVWIDVRSTIEHKLDNIDGDIRISYSEIVEKVRALYPSKDTSINLYCRSGYRSGKALSALNKAGYKNVRNFGSIENARKERGIKK